MPEPRCPACGVRLGEFCPHSCTACDGIGYVYGSPLPFLPGSPFGWCGRCYGIQLEPYYSDGERSIYLGDCRTILPLIQAKVDLVLTDPPYGLMHADSGKVQMRGRVTSLDYGAWDSCAASHDWIALLPECPSLFSFHDQKEASRIIEEATAQGFRLKHFLFWDKGNSGINPRHNFVNVVEMAAWFIANGTHSWNGGGATINLYRNDRQATPLHPTQKPERLIRWVCNLLSGPGDIILDPFLGSGTTLRAAKDLGRRGLGIEIEEKYCAIAAQRLAQAVLPLAPRRAPVGQGALPEGAA